MTRALIPLLVFALIAVFLWIGLSLNPREVPSPLIGKPAPVFELPQLRESGGTVRSEDLKGQVWLLNVFASWCTPCLEEHPHLVRLAQRPVLDLHLNVGSATLALPALQETHPVGCEGSPGLRTGSGAPTDGPVFKHIGPLSPQVLDEEVMPLVARLQQ